METRFATTIGEKEIIFDLRELASQANGTCLVRLGDTVVLVTSLMADPGGVDRGYFPLMVDYEEKFYAAGKILGSRFMRREGKPNDEAIITARLIDRAIRPLFPKGFKDEVQIAVTCLSWDGENDPDILGLVGTSLALSISDTPWEGPLGAVRVSRLDGKFILNPTYKEREQSDLDLLISGVKDGNNIVVNMIEASANEVPDEIFEQAVQEALPGIKQMIAIQEEIVLKRGKPKTSFEKQELPKEVAQEVWLATGDRLKEALFTGDPKERMKNARLVKQEVLLSLKETHQDSLSLIASLLEEETERLIHEAVIQDGKRVDNRDLDQIRELGGEVGVLPRTHGSGIFQRGETRALSILTLGAPGDYKIVEGMEIVDKKRFMHHYNFPSYSTGEIKPMRGPGRREIGHGMLVEKALLPLIPLFEEFPYTIRIVTEIVSSNGSTSMASVCASSLALMDAGVPIARPVAGISCGLMMNEKKEWKVLTDIQGPEDQHGDMDFKVAGTTKGITAVQLDVKVRGLNMDIVHQTLDLTKKARHTILEHAILPVLQAPRPDLSPYAPRILIVHIPKEKIGMVIGSGGKTIHKIVEETGAIIDIEDDGTVFISASKKEAAEKAADIVRNLVREAKEGEIFEGKVIKIMDFGAFVEVLPGQEGLVHISQLSLARVEKVEDVVKVGERVIVKVIGIDNLGRINLSMKAVGENDKPS
ncbi:MAG: polyribonucleotide nucleotidyltransferase [bacterium]|nr:polyribonucleotide nucleotidyltransferase [bacterium]